MYKVYVTELKNVRPHPNADRIVLADCFGNTVCVNKESKEGDIGVYFPEGGQVSLEFAEANNLLRKKDDAGNNIGGYMDERRKVTAIRLRGEKSDGLYLPLTCLETFGDISALSVGDSVELFNGHEIATKYIVKTSVSHGGGGNHTRKVKVEVAPLFSEHADTEQLAYNLSAFKPGDQIEITLKMHGTSQRTGYLPVFKGYKYATWIEKWFAEGALKAEKANGGEMMPWDKKIFDWIMKRATPIYDWGYVSGTRRTVLEDYEGGYYGSNAFREVHSKKFEGKLWKGETVYYEVVGFTDTGAPIMGSCGNEKLGKDFVKQYGKETVFSYGCEPNSFITQKYVAIDTIEEYPIPNPVPQSDMYVYRMTMTNEDGNVVEYTPEFMRYRCEQMGVKTVPVFEKFTLYSGEDADVEACRDAVVRAAEAWFDGPDPVGKTHVREGVVVRIINRPKFTAFKHKNYSFKVLSGIAVEKMEANGGEVNSDIASEM